MHIEVFEIEQYADFLKEAKRLVVKKKFLHLPQQIKELTAKFERGEFEGDKITHNDFPTPHDIYKIRLANPDTKAGKSNG